MQRVTFVGHNHLLDQTRVLSGKEEIGHLSYSANLMGGEHLLENTAYREMFGYVYSMHTSDITLPSIQDNAFS